VAIMETCVNNVIYVPVIRNDHIPMHWTPEASHDMVNGETEKFNNYIFKHTKEFNNILN